MMIMMKTAGTESSPLGETSWIINKYKKSCKMFYSHCRVLVFVLFYRMHYIISVCKRVLFLLCAIFSFTDCLNVLSCGDSGREDICLQSTGCILFIYKVLHLLH